MLEAIPCQATFSRRCNDYPKGVGWNLLPLEAPRSLLKSLKKYRIKGGEKFLGKNLINNYYECEDCYELEIINTNNIKASTYIDKEDYEKVKKYKWGLSVHGDDIRICSSSPELNRIYLHQFLIKNDDKAKVIDHIDRNPLNNCKKNLRITTHSINSTNARARLESKTGIRGVYFRKERPGIAKSSWICEWSINGKRYSRSFSTSKYGEEEAFRLACSLREEKLKEMKI